MIDKSTVDRIFMTADIVEIVGDFITLQKKEQTIKRAAHFTERKLPLLLYLHLKEYINVSDVVKEVMLSLLLWNTRV